MIDIIVAGVFMACVIGVGLIKSKDEDTHGEHGASDFFLAGRGLSWWLIGFSLIAANISAEQFVGMSGQGAGVYGLSTSSWEWIAAIALVVVAFVLLPYFLKAGITTIPEFLEIRYNHQARFTMTVSMLIILIGVSLIGVIYAGALTMTELMKFYDVELSLAGCCWALGAMAAIYVAVGGLKACAWADLLQGSALIVGGGVIAYYAFDKLSGAEVSTLVDSTGAAVTELSGTAIEKYNALNEKAMHVVTENKPGSPMPWPILILGIWIPNFYYWGLNQYITQRILGSASLAEGQKGLVLAAGLKLLIPFVIVIPGILAFNLYSDKINGNAVSYRVEQKIKEFKKEAENPESKKTFLVDKTSEKDLLAKVDAHNKAVIARVGAEKVIKVDATSNMFAEFEAELAALPALLEDAAKIKAIKADEKAKVKTFTLDSKWAVKDVARAESVKSYNKQVKKVFDKDEDRDDVAINPYKYDSALGVLITNLLPKNKGILGFVIAALLGAIVSSLAAVLNAASTLFSMDIYQRYIRKDATQFQIVTTGRICIGIFVVIGCVVAPLLAEFQSIFEYIQKFQGYVSTGILAVFIYGLVNRTSGKWAGVIGILANVALYGFFCNSFEGLGIKLFEETPHFLYSMSYSLIAVLAILTIYGVITKQDKPVVFESHETIKIDLTTSRGALYCGIVVCLMTVVLYVIFW